MERGEARVFKRIKRSTRRRLTAVLMVLMMTMTLFSSIRMASAETVTDYTVTIKFFEFDQTTPTTPELEQSNDPNTNYHVVVTLKDRETGEVAGYGFAVIENINQREQTLHITEFWTTEENDEGWRTTPKWVELDYDPAQYTASSVRLYYGSSPAQRDWYPGVGYSSLIKQQDTIEGYIFMGSSVETDAAVISLYKGTQKYAVRVEFDPEATEITEDDGYYILVSAKHKSGKYSYYYAPLVTDGASATVDFEVKNGYGAQGSEGKNGDWINENGSPTTEKYTGNWSPVTVKILKAVPGKTPSAKQAIDGNFVQETGSVKDCSVSYEGVTKVRDDENCVVENCDVVRLTKVSATADYNYLMVLGDAVNYGIVSGKITQSNHSESNFATKLYTVTNDFNFDPDLSGNGTENVPGNYLVGRIESDKMRFGNLTPATAAVFVGKESKDKVQNEADAGNVIVIPMEQPEIDSAIDDMISHMKRVSAAMAAKEATMEPIVVDNTVYLDTTGFEDGVTIYIDADPYNGQGKPFSKDSGLYITMKPNQTIVFNFKEATAVELSKAVVNFGDGTGDHTTATVNGDFGNEQNIYADKINQRLVWNCPKATTIDTHISGGIYLAPQNNAKMTLGDTTTGWGVCAGEVIMGNTSEYHFVYQGLKKENGVTLKVFKYVDDAPAAATEKFKFALERYNADLDAFEPVQTDLLFENDGETIEIPVTVMTGGRNIFRITEVGKSDDTTGTYTLDDKSIYAQFDVTINDLSDNTAIPGPVTYYKKFENGNLREKMNKEDRTFHNTTVTTNNDDPNGNGNNEDPNGSGNNDNPNGNGNNDNPNGNGNNEDPNGNGTNEDPNGSGTNEEPNGNGNNDNPNGNGNNEDPNGNGTNEDPNGNGNNEEPNGSGTTEEPNGSGTNEEPNGSGTTEEPNGSGTTEEPNGSGTTEEPNGSGTTEEPNGSGTTEEPNGSGTTEEPNGSGTTEEPNGSGTTEDPNGSGTTEDPNGNGTNEEPNGSGTNEEPNGSGTTEEPNGSGTTEEPNGSGTTEEPNGSGTTEEPNGSGTTEEPNGSRTTEEPNGSGTTEEPNGSGTTEEPNGSGTTEEPNGSGATDTQAGNGTTDNTEGNGATNTPADNTTQNAVTDTSQNTANETEQNTASETKQNTTGETTKTDTVKAETGLISIRVIEDKTGRAVPGAVIEVTSAADRTSVTYVTGKDGRIVDANGNTPTVAAGVYTVKITKVPDGYDVVTGKTGNLLVVKNSENLYEAIVSTSSDKTTTPGEESKKQTDTGTSGEESKKQIDTGTPEVETETSVKTADTISKSRIFLMLLLSILTMTSVILIKKEQAKEQC